MKGIYSLLFGAALGASSIFIHSFYPPVGLVVSLVATGMGIWLLEDCGESAPINSLQRLLGR